MKLQLSTLLAAAFGAIAPNLVGMAQQAVRGHPDASAGYLYANAGFWVGTMIFAVMGIGIAWSYSEKSKRRAVALGAAAPALILGWAQGSGDQASSHTAAGAMRVKSPIVSVTYAAESPLIPVLSRQQRDHVWVLVTGLVSGDTASDLVVVLGSTSTQPDRVVFRLHVPSEPIAIPGSAKQVYLTVHGESSNLLPVPNADTLKLELKARTKSFWGGFRRAFGIRDRSTPQLEIQQVRMPTSTGLGMAPPVLSVSLSREKSWV
ncbi:MAG TPA: hypothetical protein VKB45_15805 [Gemmatimonadales bacterium]|nr:hypothetical protein [Gemmatimonadales bacterium]